MSIKRVSPQQAHELIEKEGRVHLDVRSIPEFEQGHPEGAYNVPLSHMTPSGMEPNSDFVDVLKANFPPDTKFVVGCRSGGRSMRAAELMLQQGYCDVIDQRAGFAGSSAAGHPEAGWAAESLPTATDPKPGRSYEELAKKAGKD